MSVNGSFKKWNLLKSIPFNKNNAKKNKKIFVGKKLGANKILVIAKAEAYFFKQKTNRTTKIALESCQVARSL